MTKLGLSFISLRHTLAQVRQDGTMSGCSVREISRWLLQATGRA